MDTPISPVDHAAPRSTATQNSTPKLRDSCQACAASKLKCSKEKPSCARCVKRSRNCEYLATRRAGRKTLNRTADTPRHSEPTQVPTPTATVAPEALRADAAIHFPEQYVDDASETSSSPDIRSEPSGLITPVDMDLGMPDFLPPASPFQIPELSGGHSRMGSIASSLSDWPMSYPFDSSVSVPMYESNTMGFINGHITHIQTPMAYSSLPSISGQTPSPVLKQPILLNSQAQPHCSCYARAHELSGHFCSGPPARSKQDLAQTIQSPQLIQSVVLDNQHAIEAITNIIGCSCSQDSFLLMTLSIVLFKIMDRYEEAVCDPAALPERYRKSTSEATINTQLPLHLSPNDLDYCYVGGDDPSQVAAHAVLGDLHRVQRLCQRFSSRIHAMAGPRLKDGPMGPDTASPSPISPGGMDDFPREGLPTNMTNPFSPGLFHQLEADLRKRLRSLSTAVAGQLIKA